MNSGDTATVIVVVALIVGITLTSIVGSIAKVKMAKYQCRDTKKEL